MISMREVQQRFHATWFAGVVACVLPGCDSSAKSTPPSVNAAEVTAENWDEIADRDLTAGTPVELLDVAGGYARVRLGDRSETFIPRSALVSLTTKQMVELSSGATHRIAGELTSFTSAPSHVPPPRRIVEITAERLNLNCLFLGTQSGREVIAACSQEETTDPQTGERCLRAYECANPNCPGEGTSERPYLFGAGREHARGGGISCPACLAIRDLNQESEQQRIQYIIWPRPYELPETTARIKQLAEERRRALANLRRPRAGS
ncbi:MAG: hypothetical protein MI757_04510 [Pirellulales bacterium]|nr:hypothetical protein [Pirellulales bacterium]